MSPAQETTGVPTPPDTRPVGIGGWLVLPIIVLIFMIVAGAFQLTAFPALREVTGGMPQWKIYLLSLQVLLSAVISIICPIALLVMLFRKQRRFPRLFIAWAIAYLVFVVVSHFMVVVFVGDFLGTVLSDRLSAGALRSLLLSVAPVAALIPYMLKSRRVQNTFVN